MPPQALRGVAGLDEALTLLRPRWESSLYRFADLIRDKLPNTQA